jgi:hypothetical protein
MNEDQFIKKDSIESTENKPEDGKTNPEQSAEKEDWSLEVLENVKNIAPSQFHPEKKWLATHFKIDRPDGTSEEMESTKIILKIKSKDGTEIEVPAFAVSHIMSLHFKGEEAGSTMETGNLEESFKLLAKHLPEKLPFGKESAAFEVDMKQNTGTEGVTSQKEMLEKGIVTSEDLEILAGAKEEVFKLNKGGSDEDKQKFVDEYNKKLEGKNVKLGIRGGAIAPFFSAERQPTSKMFLVVGKEKYANRVWTMTPGRFMDKLPNDGKFIGRYPVDGVPEGSKVSDLWKKAGEGIRLSEAEMALVDEQREAQECWWNGGFIAPPEKNKPVTENKSEVKEKLSDQASAIADEIEKWADEHAEFAMGYSFEDAAKEVLEKYLEKIGKNPDDINLDEMINSDSDTEFEDDDTADDGRTKGNLEISGEKIPFSSYSDGADFRINIEKDEMIARIHRALENIENNL